MSFQTPKYRLHKGSGQALVQINGERIYLGKYGTEASKEQYRRLVAEFLTRGQMPGPGARSPSQATSPIKVNELILAFWHHANPSYEAACNWAVIFLRKAT